MLSSILKIFSVALAIAFAAASGAATANVVLEGDVKVVRNVTVDGKSVEQFETPDRVVPGDRLIFSTSYSNQAGAPVDNFVVTNPLPAAVQLSEMGDFQVSIDGGATFGALSGLTVRAEADPRPAAVSDVTHVRWTLVRLEPGARGVLKYKAVVR